MRFRNLLVLMLLLGVLATLLVPRVFDYFDRSNRGPLPVVSAASPFSVRVLAEGLEHPWGMARLPDGRWLLTERPGRLQLLAADGRKRSISGLPKISAVGQGGLLDVALHPAYAENGWLYLSYVAAGVGGIGTEVLRAKLQRDHLTDVEVLFRMQPKSEQGQHFGSRLAFDPQGYLYITLGDRGERQRAQDLDDHAGALIRLHDDGSVPADNPFVGRSDVRPEIFSYGHRNMQGMAVHPQTGVVWTHEHGPQGGDELNPVAMGRNYGWPVISYGVNYGTATPIGEGSHKAGMEQPVHYWVPSIAPSGMAFYRGAQFPQWQGDLLIGALKFQLLVRLEMDADRVRSETRYLEGELGRIRDVQVDEEGFIYLLTDEDDGRLIRLGRQ